MSVEHWKPVVGCKRLYDVSSLGRVRSKRSGIGLTQWTLNGYQYVSLQKIGRRVSRPVHLLVLEAFVGPRPYALESNHSDGNKGNNSLANLQYITHKENVQHAIKTGSVRRGNRVYCAILTEGKIMRACRKIARGRSMSDVAYEIGVSKGVLWKAISRNGTTWRHIQCKVAPVLVGKWPARTSG